MKAWLKAIRGGAGGRNRVLQAELAEVRAELDVVRAEAARLAARMDTLELRGEDLEDAVTERLLLLDDAARRSAASLKDEIYARLGRHRQPSE